jgi:hypothetical protein
MTKQELIQAAKEIREICENTAETWDDCEKKKCPFCGDDGYCVFINCPGQDAFAPLNWDIEQLERGEDGR